MMTVNSSITQRKETFVIVGAGMAGSKLAEKVLETFAGRFHVILIGEEPSIGYNRILLSSVLADEIEEKEIALIDLEMLKNEGLQTIAGNPVVHVDPLNYLLTLQDGNQIAYDTLVFATGSRPSLLPISGIHSSNVMGFRTLADVRSMMSLPSQQTIVVIGGGLLGLEAAVGLVKQGHSVRVVQRAEYLLNRQLDSVAARMLQQRLENMGVEFTFGASPIQFHPDPSNTTCAQRLELSDGQQCDADLFVLATGIVPEIGLAKAAGFDVGRAIRVNASMETSFKDHFAIGECTEFEGETFGLVAPIWEQLRCLLVRLNNDEMPFQITPIPTQLKVSGVQLFSVGDIDCVDENKVITYIDHEHHHYRKLVIHEGLITGILLYGQVEDGGWYFKLMQEKVPVNPILDELIFGEVFCHQKIAKAKPISH